MYQETNIVASKDYPEVDMETYEADELSRINYLEKMFTAAKDSRKNKVNRWRRNE